MAGATRYAKSICVAEMLVREMFSTCEIHGDEWPAKIGNLQKQFTAVLRLMLRQFESLKSDLACWRQEVSSGEVDFDPAREDDFRMALRGLIAISDLLDAKSKEFHDGGIYLTKPRFLGLLQTYHKEAQKILDSWQSPEWEVAGVRTVKWNKEQTRHLRARLASCE